MSSILAVLSELIIAFGMLYACYWLIKRIIEELK